MKASELRVGNWINHKYSPPSFIVSVINTFNENTVNGIELEDCEPIQLTEEWLLKFGFKKIKSDYEEAETYDFFNEKLYFNMANQSIKMNGIYILSFIPDYVHQLQNLYFALTGEELTTHHE